MGAGHAQVRWLEGTKSVDFWRLCVRLKRKIQMKRFSIILRRATPQASRGERRFIIVRAAPPIEEAPEARGGSPCRCFDFEMFSQCKAGPRMDKVTSNGGHGGRNGAKRAYQQSRLEKVVVCFEKLDYVFAIFAMEFRSTQKSKWLRILKLPT